jgi:hypothetical protein
MENQNNPTMPIGTLPPNVAQLTVLYAALSKAEKKTFLDWIEKEVSKETEETINKHIDEFTDNVGKHVDKVSTALDEFGTLCSDWTKKHFSK